LEAYQRKIPIYVFQDKDTDQLGREGESADVPRRTHRNMLSTVHPHAKIPSIIISNGAIGLQYVRISSACPMVQLSVDELTDRPTVPFRSEPSRTMSS